MRVTGSRPWDWPRRMSWSMPMRKAARVLPEPVGAATRVSRPERMAGQAAAWASVGGPEGGAEPAGHEGVERRGGGVGGGEVGFRLRHERAL